MRVGRLRITAFRFAPPLRLAGKPVATVQSLDEAAAYLRGYKGARWPMTQNGVLHRIEGAKSEAEQIEAANAFRAWAEAEGLVIKP